MVAASDRSWLNRADAAAVFGTAVAMRAAHADLVEFGTTSAPVVHREGESVLEVLERFGSLGGTDTTEAVRRHYRGQDRVLIVTDEQAAYRHAYGPTERVLRRRAARIRALGITPCPAGVPKLPGEAGLTAWGSGRRAPPSHRRALPRLDTQVKTDSFAAA